MHAVPRVVASGIGPLILEYIDCWHPRRDGARVRARARRARRGAARRRRPTCVVMMENRNETRLEEDVARARVVALRARRDRRVRAAVGIRAAVDRSPGEGVLAREGSRGRRHHRHRRASRGRSPTTWSAVVELARENSAFVAGCGHAGDGNIHLSVYKPDPEERSKLLHASVRDRDGVRGRDLWRTRHRHDQDASTSSSSRIR